MLPPQKEPHFITFSSLIMSTADGLLCAYFPLSHGSGDRLRGLAGLLCHGWRKSLVFPPMNCTPVLLLYVLTPSSAQREVDGTLPCDISHAYVGYMLCCC